MSDKAVYQTIVFADIAGSSQLYKDLGDVEARRLVGQAVDEMGNVVTQHHGHVVKTIGDEVMARFDAPSDATDAAIAIQRLRHKSQPRLMARIGLHYGPTLTQADDVFGEAVNDAAALVKIAKGGQIITSTETVRELSERLKALTRRFDKVTLKGSRAASVIYLLDWEQDTTASEATQMVSAITDAHTIPPGTVLELQYRDQRVAIDSGNTPFIIGRDPAIAHLAVNDSVASRDHVRIEYRRGKFVLVDNSTNGTWVALDNHEPIYLRREELPLTDVGRISVGRRFPTEEEPDNPHVIRFRF